MNDVEPPADASDQADELGRWWEPDGDWWRAFVVDRYPAVVAPVPQSGGERFAAVVDGDLLEGPDETRPFLFASAYDAMMAADEHVQDRLWMPNGITLERRFIGAWSNGADVSDHDAVVEKWLRLLARA